MPFSYKLAIVLIFIGFMTRMMCANRNWLFGYRSSMSMKSHKHFDFANKIAGTATMIFGILYLGLLLVSDYLIRFDLAGWPNAIIVVSFFLVLILIVEISLRKKFGR